MTNLCDRVDEIAARRADRVAIRHRRPVGRVETLTYAALAERSSRIVHALDRVAAEECMIPLYVTRSGPAIATMLAAERTGRAFSWLDRRLRPPQIAPLLRMAGASVLVVDETARRARERAGSPPGVRLVDIESLGMGGALSSTAHDPAQPGAILFTSGSTGEPRGVVVSAADLDDRSETEAAWFGLGPEDVLLNIRPRS